MAVGDMVVHSGALEVRVTADPFGVEFVDFAGGTVLRTASAPSAADDAGGAGLFGFGFQTTTSVGERRWRAGPGGTPLGPEHEEPPPAQGWFGVRRLSSSGGSSQTGAVWATADDPETRRCRLVIRAVADGVVRVRLLAGDPSEGESDVEAVGVSFVAQPGEAWLGFGERSDQVVRKAGVVEHYLGEGPYQEYEYPFLDGIVPPWGVRQRKDATYFPLPWVLSTRGVGIAVDNDETSYARLRPAGAAAETWGVEAEASWLGFHVFAGPRPLDALRRYSELAGRQPAPAAPWYFGPWYQTGHANHVPSSEERRQLGLLRAARAPVSAAETHCRYLPLGAHLGHADEERARVAQFHAAGLAVLSYLNPLVGVDFASAFEPAAAAGGLLRRPDGSAYTFPAYVGGQDPPSTLEAHFDFASPAGRAAWAAVAGELVAAGYDGWMEDFGEYTPLDAVGGPRGGDGIDGGNGAATNGDGSGNGAATNGDGSGNGAVYRGGPVASGGAMSPGGAVTAGGGGGTAAHNRYATDYHAAAAEVAVELEARAGRPLARFVRSGWSGTAPHVPIVWGGDPTTGWEWDGLASAVVEGLSAGASGLAMWGSDIGGFLSSAEHLTPELLCRWIAFGALCPVMRTKSEGLDLGDYCRPQIWDDDVIGVWSRWAAWHTQLNPYLQAAHELYRRSGRPIMCALALADPADEAAVGLEDEYWFGPDLVVAPVLTSGAQSRSVYAPRVAPAPGDDSADSSATASRHDSAESSGPPREDSAEWESGYWVDLWRAVRYDPATRALEMTGAGAVPLVAGGRRVELPAPRDEIPVLLRAGAVVPLLSAEVDTLAEWGTGNGSGIGDVVHASEREGIRRLLAFPRGVWSGGLGAGERIRSDANPHRWRLEVTSQNERRYELRADLSYSEGGTPADVALAEGDATWSYNPGTGVLVAEWRSATLEFALSVG